MGDSPPVPPVGYTGFTTSPSVSWRPLPQIYTSCSYMMLMYMVTHFFADTDEVPEWTGPSLCGCLRQHSCLRHTLTSTSVCQRLWPQPPGETVPALSQPLRQHRPLSVTERLFYACALYRVDKQGTMSAKVCRRVVAGCGDRFQGKVRQLFCSFCSNADTSCHKSAC